MGGPGCRQVSRGATKLATIGLSYTPKTLITRWDKATGKPKPPQPDSDMVNLTVSLVLLVSFPHPHPFPCLTPVEDNSTKPAVGTFTSTGGHGRISWHCTVLAS